MSDSQSRSLLKNIIHNYVDSLILGVQLADVSVVHRALSCPQRIFYTATATEDDVTS